MEVSISEWLNFRAFLCVSVIVVKAAWIVDKVADLQGRDAIKKSVKILIYCLEKEIKRDLEMTFYEEKNTKAGKEHKNNRRRPPHAWQQNMNYQSLKMRNSIFRFSIKKRFFKTERKPV